MLKWLKKDGNWAVIALVIWLIYEMYARAEARFGFAKLLDRFAGTEPKPPPTMTPSKRPGQYFGEVAASPAWTHFTRKEIDPDGTLRRLPGGPAMLDGVAAEFERIRANFDPPQPFTVNSRIVTADRRLRFSLKVTPPVTAWQSAFNKLTTTYLNERPSVLSPVFGTDDGLVVETNPTRFT